MTDITVERTHGQMSPTYLCQHEHVPIHHTQMLLRLISCTESVPNGVKKRAKDDEEFVYATGYFSEEYIDSEDIMKLWPADFQDAKNVDIESETYINQCLEALDDFNWFPSTSGASPWQCLGSACRHRREVNEYIEAPPVTTTDVVIAPRKTGMIAYEHEKRFVSKCLYRKSM